MAENPMFLSSALSRRAVVAGAGLGALSLGAVPWAAEPVPANGPAPDLAARAAVSDLFSRFCWARDCTDEEEYLALFTEDALVVGMGKYHAGKPAIGAWLRYLLGMRGEDDWLHEAGQFRFFARGEAILAYAYATHFNGNRATGIRGVRSLGRFAAECVRQRAEGVGDEWRFRRFAISPWDRNHLPWKQALPWQDAV